MPWFDHGVNAASSGEHIVEISCDACLFTGIHCVCATTRVFVEMSQKVIISHKIVKTAKKARFLLL